MNPLSLYIHFPWCIQKCPYCDFNSHAVKDTIPEKNYIEVLLRDLARDIEFFQETRPLQSIFMGGGTPSLFSATELERLLGGIQQQLDFADNIEITLEANPSTFESQKFIDYRQIGINRLSIGVQSFHPHHLKRLGRIHSAQEAIEAAHIAREAGFDNLNLDLMFGLPNSTLTESIADIKQAIALRPTHLSFYQLTLEPNTYFYKYPPKLPDEDHIFTAQLACQDILEAHGYIQYEVSAYAQDTKQCQHNINYWSFGDYLGIGAGAHGKINHTRTSKVKRPEHYLQENQQERQYEVILPEDLPLEFLMNHLRLKKGFNLSTFVARTGLNSHCLQQSLEQCLHENLLQKHGEQYLCTEKGWHFLDSILEKFLNL